MVKYIVLAYCIAAAFFLASPKRAPQSVPKKVSTKSVVSTRQMSLDKRYSDAYVNDVFKKNILLTMSYMKSEVKKGEKVNWSKVESPFTYVLKLEAGSVFAFHDILLPQYSGKVSTSLGLQFNSYEGFLSDGYLVGDGVCHLASLINWAARDAGLEVVAPTNHDFAYIPQVPREYGVSIYSTSAEQNLYIKNTFEKEVLMKFAYDGENLRVSVVRAS